MKKIIISRRFVLISLGLLALMVPAVSSAMTMLAYPTVTRVTETSATLVGRLEQADASRMVWFEWGETPDLGQRVGFTTIWKQGSFSGDINNLRPGTTYYFQEVSTEGGQRIGSQILSFTTKGTPQNYIPAYNTYNTVTPIVVNQVAYPTQGASVISTVTPAKNISAAKISQAAKTKEATTGNPCITAPSKPFGFSAGGPSSLGASASVFAMEDGFFPNTLIGWIALFVAILTLVLIGHIVFEKISVRKEEPVLIADDELFDEDEKQDQKRGKKGP